MKCLMLVAILSSVSAAPHTFRYRRSAESSEVSSDPQPPAEESQPAVRTSGRQGKAFNFGLDQTESEEPKQLRKRPRQNKALSFFDYVPQFYSDDDYDEEDLVFNRNENIDDDDNSRTIPSRRKQNIYKNNNNNFANTNSLSYDNSPIFYIRLPPTPYMFVPGLGYVSQPPSIGPPIPPPVNPFINLPIDFVSNGKPTNIYQWTGGPSYQPQTPVDPYNQVYQRPSRPQNSRPNNGYNSYQKPIKKPISDSKVTNLKGPYVFNGKPNDIFVLRDSYNSLYSDALQNFYP